MKIEIGKMGEGPKKMEDVSHPKIMPHAAVKNPVLIMSTHLSILALDPRNRASGLQPPSPRGRTQSCR